MTDRMERLVVLPFSVGCVSQSSLDVSTSQPTKPNHPAVTSRQELKESSTGTKMKMKNSWGFLGLPKPKLSNGIHRLARSLKSLSQLFVYKEEEIDDMEMKMEMEIGFPTDVKHVTHIGWDGTATTNPVKGWENLTAPEILSFPSISLKQFELAMAAQADGPMCFSGSKFT
ncbi:hypothetical protein ACSBR1_012960 [Camellia fascicularis]